MARLFFESLNDIKETHDAILGVLSNLGYQIQEDKFTKILAHHPHALKKNMWAHNVNIELNTKLDKSYIVLNIDHISGDQYIKKLHKKLVKLPGIAKTSGAILDDIYIGNKLNKKWIKEIEERKILKSDEEMKAIIKGGIESSWGWGDVETDKTKHGRTAIARNGALICTDQRLIFYMPKILDRWEIETAPLDQISSVNYNKGLIQGRIHITVFNDEKVIKWIDNEDGKAMVDIIEKQVDLVKAKDKILGTSASLGDDPLKVLKLRFVQGEISEEEYIKMMKLIEGY